jgi:Domain of unknown function (DUF4124)
LEALPVLTGEKKMTHTNCLLAIFFSLILAQVCLADIYQYTDNEGVVHFTDDPQNIPAKLRGKTKKETEAPLTTKDTNMLEHMMQIDKTKDIPVKNSKEFKNNLNDFSEGYKEKYDDPDQTKDSRLSTPDSALSLFHSALRTGDLKELRASVTSRFWQGFEGESNPQLIKKFMFEMERRLASHIVSKGEQNEHRAVFELKEKSNGPIVGTIELINLFGNWKIHRL